MKKIIMGITIILFIISAGCIRVVVPNGGNSDTGISPGQQPAVLPTQQPVAYIDSVSPTTVYVGDPVALNGRGTDSDGLIVGYEWSSSLDGVVSTAPSFTTTSLSVGTHIIYLRVIDNSSLWSEEVSTTVTVNPRAVKPVIASFVAFPDSVVFGGSMELSWSVSGANTVSIDKGIGQVTGTGSLILYPSVNTVYTLTASNQSGSVTATASVTVLQSSYAGNPVIDFTATHLGGTSWQLNWNVSNSTQQTITPEIGPVYPTGSAVVTVPSGQTKIYRLEAVNDNSGGWAWWQVQLMSP
jgi:hypothetical protein